MNPVAAMALHGVLSTVVAPLAVAAWRPSVRVPAPPAWLLFVAAQWALHLDRHVPAAFAHPLFAAAAVAFWAAVLPLPGPARSLALFLAAPATDLVAAALFTQGRDDEAVAMLVSMLPLALAAFWLTWTWIRDEEREAVRAAA